MTLETAVWNLLIDADNYQLPRLQQILQEYLITLGFDKTPVKYFLVVRRYSWEPSYFTRF